MGIVQPDLSMFFHHHDFAQGLQLLWQQKYGQDYLDRIQSSGHDESRVLGESFMMLMTVSCLGLPSFPKTCPHHLKL
jgi:hypothetical protein